MATQTVSHAQSRRSTRITQALPLTVQGVAAARVPYQERVLTVMINCHGCTYRSGREVKPGDLVYLDVNPIAAGSLTCSNRAQVRRVQKIQATELAFEVAVELEFPGNIWGVPFPPEDWFPSRFEKTSGLARPSQILRVESRKKQQATAPQGRGSPQVSHAEGAEIPARSPDPIAELMIGSGEQTHSMASDAATTAFVNHRNRLLEEFRMQLNEQSSKTLNSVVSAFKVEFSRSTLRQLQDAHEAIARTSLESWRKKLGQDIEAAVQHMAAQVQEASKRINEAAIGSFDLLQEGFEASRTEAADRFVSRLRDRIGPLLEESKARVQQLETSLVRLNEKSQITCAQFENQIGLSVNTRVAKAEEELQRKSTAVVKTTSEALHSHAESFQKEALASLESHASSAVDQFATVLDARMTEICHQFWAELKEHTFSYFESISKSIADISSNTAIHSVQIPRLRRHSWSEGEGPH